MVSCFVSFSSTAPRSKSPRSRPMSISWFHALESICVASWSAQPGSSSSTPVSSGSAQPAISMGGGTLLGSSNFLWSKIRAVDMSSGQFSVSPEPALYIGIGGISRRDLAGMCTAMSLPCSCSSSFGMNSCRLCAFAVSAASGTWPISASTFTRSSTDPSISALLKRDITSFRFSAIFSIFSSFCKLPVIRYRKDTASKFLVLW
mmetsp:Transcript_71974/g.187648  ORF Transcript_71974/g.187648 Transcript_71974/m.187648 type:complete len:204 (+) Transcript_71974:1143-1754(+)